MAKIYFNKLSALLEELAIENEANQLIKSGKAIPLKYFPKGHIKKGYAVFQQPNERKANYWKKYFIKSAQQV